MAKKIKKSNKAVRDEYRPIRLSLDADQEPQTEDKTPRSGKELRNILIVGGVLVLIFAVFFALRWAYVDVNNPEEIREVLNETYEEQLNVSDAYVYNNHSLAKIGDLWYSEIRKGNTIYDISFNYGPKEVEDILVEGKLNDNFLKGEEYFITFDPLGEDLKYVAIANYGLTRSLSKAFGLKVKAGCSRNETADCAGALIITCDDEDRNVFFFKEDDTAKIVFDDNCVIIQGRGEDLVRAKDRLLLRWYKIME